MTFSKVAAVLRNIPREGSPVCANCLEGFSPGTEQWTHVDGYGHDPFHRKCLYRIVESGFPCPYEGIFIDATPLMTLGERIFKASKCIALNSACAALLAITAKAAAGIGVFTGLESSERARIAAVTAAALGGEIMEGLREWEPGLIVGTAGLIGAGALISMLIVEQKEQVTDAEVLVAERGAGLGLTLGATALVVDIAARRLFERININQADQSSIGLGMLLSGAAVTLSSAHKSLAPYAFPLACGIAAGIVSLTKMRRLFFFY